MKQWFSIIVSPIGNVVLATLDAAKVANTIFLITCVACRTNGDEMEREIVNKNGADTSSPFFKDMPIRSTFGEEGRLTAIANAFVRHIVACSARKLSKNSRTAKTSIAYIDYDMDRVYPIIQKNYGEFAALVTETKVSEKDEIDGCLGPARETSTSSKL